MIRETEIATAISEDSGSNGLSWRSQKGREDCIKGLSEAAEGSGDRRING